MANAPDLNTSQVGYIAFWNAIDQGGVSSIDPNEVTSQANIASTTLYDNAVDGKYNGATGRELDFRVKNDGWFVVWIDRSNTFAQEQHNGPIPHGYIDVAKDWTAGDWDSKPPVSTLAQGTLQTAIDNLRQELSNSGAITFNYSDVGLYNYEFSGATTSSLLSVGHPNITGSTTYTFSYTSGTSILWAVAAATSESDDEQDNALGQFEGITLVDNLDAAGGGSDKEYGTIDLLDQGVIPNSGTSYGHTMDTGSAGASIKGDVLLLWN